jgi:hypothetical protein
MDVQGLGAKGVLDFLCSAELALDASWQPSVESWPLPPASVHHTEPLAAADLAHLKARLAELERQPWVPLVRGDDPRFADLLPGVSGTLADLLIELRASEPLVQTVGQAIDRVTPEIVARIRAIESKTLDGQLLEIIMKAGRVTEERAVFLAEPLQWNGRERELTLEKTGELMSVTRERVRQLRDRTIEALPEGPVFLPALDAALELIAAKIPLSAAEMANALVDGGITSVLWSIEGLSKVAQDFDRPVTYGVTGQADGRVVVAASHAELHDSAARYIKRHLKHLGPTRIEDLWKSLPARIGEGVDLADFSLLIQALPEYTHHEAGWCWKRGVLAAGLRKPICQMLAVAPSLAATSLWAGLERHARFTRSRRQTEFGEHGELAPLPVIVAYLRECDQVTIDTDEVVQWNGPLLDDVFGPTDSKIVELVHESPDGLANREALLATWADDNRNRMTLLTMLSYAPYLQRVRRGTWALRGCTHLPEVEGQGYARGSANAGIVQECMETAPGHFVISLTVPDSPVWETIELPLELADGWDGTRYLLEIPTHRIVCELDVVALGPTPGMVELLDRLGAQSGEVLQLRVDTNQRRGVAEVMSRADYSARVGDE